MAEARMRERMAGRMTGGSRGKIDSARETSRYYAARASRFVKSTVPGLFGNRHIFWFSQSYVYPAYI